MQQVINRLEAEALAAGGDANAGERAASAVAALDALRLDLLRLSTAGARPGELTRELAEADEIGQRIDERVESKPELTPR